MSVIKGCIRVLIQQINRDQSNIERFKAGRTGIQISDMKETGDTTDAAEVIIALYGPNRDKLNTYRGYDIKSLGSNFRVVTVLKNRYGEADVEVGCAFYGKISYFAELPKPDEIYDYDKYNTPNWILNKDNVKEDKVTNVQKPKFTL